MKRLLPIVALATACISAGASAQTPPDRQIDDGVREAVVAALGKELREGYVFPEVAERVARELSEKEKSGAYDEAGTAIAFAELLDKDLQSLGDDRHFGIRYRPGFKPMPRGDDVPSADQIAQMRLDVARGGFGIARVTRLPGNIGYLDVRWFGPPEIVAPAYESAMQLLSGSDALIVDVRANSGGDPESVALLMSHFFAEGDQRHVNSIYFRPDDTTREFWTDRTVETRFTGPVFVITSHDTFSGGEEFAYDMQTQKRATLIGETTGGGANPGGTTPLAEGFTAFIPNGRAINPITGTNWEHVGVEPDRTVAAPQAIAAGYIAALEAARGAADDPETKADLDEVLEKTKAGQIQLPDWEPRG